MKKRTLKKQRIARFGFLTSKGNLIRRYGRPKTKTRVYNGIDVVTFPVVGEWSYFHNTGLCYKPEEDNLVAEGIRLKLERARVPFTIKNNHPGPLSHMQDTLVPHRPEFDADLYPDLSRCEHACPLLEEEV